MAPKPSKEEAPDAESTRSQFINKLTATADAMRKFGNFAEALAKVALKVPLDDPELLETFQSVIDATPTISRKRKLADLTDDGGKRRKREKKVKDPNAPKAPPSAYIMFQNDVRNLVRAEHPGVQYKELMGLISKQWNALPQDKKQPYFDKVNDAKKSHEVDMAKYIAEHPSVEEGPSSKKAKKAAVVPAEIVEPAPKPSKKAAAAAAPKSAERVDSSESGSEDSDDSSGDEEQPTNGKPSDEEDGEDGSESDQSIPAPKQPSPPPRKRKSEKRK